MSRLADLVGLDVAIEVGKQHIAARPGRTYISQFYSLLVDDGRLGKPPSTESNSL